jgi:hypothetical protein
MVNLTIFSFLIIAGINIVLRRDCHIEKISFGKWIILSFFIILFSVFVSTVIKNMYFTILVTLTMGSILQFRYMRQFSK